MRPIDNNLVDPQHSWKPRLTINITNKDSPFQKSYQAVTVDKDENIGLHDLLLGFRKCYEGVFAYELRPGTRLESRIRFIEDSNEESGHKLYHYVWGQTRVRLRR
ncbi:predicted protein [Sclerotinia sclerotiorum 1980 UF-70]|uniref:Uncharacterized protein n=1 Tax=Sclerotinia sclerotiorum (strain ATCC 18683 / 1980 / Ss-1) TaxID=665079 RepID=A7F117_SCLS1|nr:predicted protein [Sclerotinia sclerotiorum 1980 UF-70]EDN95409.1 predicted protein [Sclerotinia sclerotiorum 1980 UF-70]